ncbi:MAG: helix-turn-helix domain-containing protein, partial [Thermocrispum sp.]
RELAMVVRHAAASPTTGEITAADLPEAYRTPVSPRPLTPWQQAEHDAIVSALRATAGNKLQAAERLGISRTTLYNHIRAMKITV